MLNKCLTSDTLAVDMMSAGNIQQWKPASRETFWRDGCLWIPLGWAAKTPSTRNPSNSQAPLDTANCVARVGGRLLEN